MANEEEKKVNYAEETVRLLREQTDALKAQQKLTQQTTEQNKAQLSLSRSLARIAADQAASSEDNLDNLKSTGDIAKDLLKAEKVRDAIASEFKSSSFAIKKLLAEQLRNAKELVAKEKERKETSEKIDKSMGIAGKSLGVVNKLLGGSLKDTKDIEENTRKRLASLEKENKLLPGLGGKMQGFGIQIHEVGKSLLKNLNDPMTYLMLLFENSKSVTQFQNELGMSYKSSIGLRNEMSGIAISTGDVFINSKKIQESFFNMSKSLGFVADYSGQTLETMTNLEKRLGMATGEAAEMTMMLKLQSNNTEDIASNTMDVLTNTIKTGNVALTPKQIFTDIAKTTKSITVSLNANPVAIGKAIIAAKQFGAELADINTMAGALLDFESSISAELEAELLTGKQLNFEKARLLALNNDFEGVAKEVAKQGIDYNFMTKANRLEQEAAAKALGVSRDRLAEITFQQRIQGMSAKEIKDQLGEGAYKQAKALDASTKFAAAVEKIKGLFSDIMVLLTPLIDGIALIADFASGIGGAFTGIGIAIAGIVKYGPALLKMVKAFKFQSIGAAIANIWGKLVKQFGLPGAIIAGGVTAGLIATIAKHSMKDGVIGPGGETVVSGPKGSIQIDGDDSMIVGSNLGGGGGREEIDYDKMASAMSKARINVTTKHDSFSANSTTAHGGNYQSDARYESKYV